MLRCINMVMVSSIVMFVLGYYFFVLSGDLPNEAHVQTHSGGAPSEPPVTPADRVSQHPHPHLPHLSRKIFFGVCVRPDLPGPHTYAHSHQTYSMLPLWQLAWEFGVRFRKRTTSIRLGSPVKSEHSGIFVNVTVQLDVIWWLEECLASDSISTFVSIVYTVGSVGQ